VELEPCLHVSRCAATAEGKCRRAIGGALSAGDRGPVHQCGVVSNIAHFTAALIHSTNPSSRDRLTLTVRSGGTRCGSVGGGGRAMQNHAIRPFVYRPPPQFVGTSTGEVSRSTFHRWYSEVATCTQARAQSDFDTGRRFRVSRRLHRLPGQHGWTRRAGRRYLPGIGGS
jgi:hypothetical protein